MPTALEKGKKGKLGETRPPFPIREQDAEKTIQQKVNSVLVSKDKDWIELFVGGHIPRDKDAGPSHPGFSCPEAILVRVGDRIMVSMGVDLRIYESTLSDKGVRIRLYNSFRTDSVGRTLALVWERGERERYLKVKRF